MKRSAATALAIGGGLQPAAVESSKKQRLAEQGIDCPSVSKRAVGGIQVTFTGCHITAPVSLQINDPYEGIDDDEVPITEWARRHFKLDAKKYDSFLKWEARQSLRRKQAVSSTPMSNSNLTADF
jgi:hypothetical protein